MDDLISRQAAIDAIDDANNSLVEDDYTYGVQSGMEKAKYVIEELPSVQPEIIRCKDCKHWRDSDGVYRRGTNAESKCPLNTQEVYAGTFYCGYAERRTDEK